MIIYIHHIARDKRTEATFEHVDWFDGRFNSLYLAGQDSEKMVMRFLLKHNGHREVSAIATLMKFQKTRAAENLKVRYDKIKAAEDIVMLLIRPMPKDFQNWMDEVPLAKSRYIFYQYKDRAELDGYCTACQHDVKIRKPHHNTMTKCPHCGRQVTYKTMTRSTNVMDDADVAYIQKIKDGYVIRYFTVKKSYYQRYMPESTCYIETKYTQHERAREFEMDEGHQMFMWDNFRQTGEYRFCKVYSSYISGNNYIYNRNLKEMFKNEQSRRKYFPHSDFLKNSGPVRPREYLTEIIRTPQMEYLAKMKLYKYLAGGISGQYNYSDVIGNKKDIHLILGLPKDYLPIIQKMNLSYDELKWFTRGLKYGIDQAILLVNYINVNVWSVLHQRMINLVRHASPIKLTKYLDNQYKNLKGQKKNSYSYSTINCFGDIVCLMDDYLKNCIKLKYDLKNDFILYPLDIRAAHDATADRVVKLEKKIEKDRFAQIAKIAEETNQLYAWKTTKLLIRAPHHYDDLIAEGHELRHCVGTYAMDVAMEKSVILFIRKVDEPDEPYFTLEYKNDQISQCRGKCNCWTTPEIDKFIEQWERRLQQLKLKSVI